MLFLIFDTPEEANKFLALYKTYRKTIHDIVRNYIADTYLVEDISQDVLIRLAGHLDKINLKRPEQAKNYITTATRNYCINYLRDHNKISVEPLNENFSLHTDSDELVNKIIFHENISEIAQAVSELNDIYKSVLELKYVNGMSNNEIAKFLHIKKKTVDTRLYRATVILQNKLGERFHDK